MEENKKNGGQTEDFIELGELILLCVRKWHWFAVSFAIVLALAILYILKTPESYTRTAEVQIKSEAKNGPSMNIQNAFNDMGGMFAMNTNVNNELRALLSSDVMFEVVRRLNLDVNYSIDGSFHGIVLYGSNLPVLVSFLDLTDYDNVYCDVFLGDSVASKDYVKIDNFAFTSNGEVKQVHEPAMASLGDTINTCIGRLVVQRNLRYTGNDINSMHVTRTNMFTSQENWSGSLNVTQDDEKADIITLEVKDVSIQRADDILDMLIKVYNENWIKDKNQIADGTSMFINERLNIIENELSSVDNDISSYKSKNLLPDVKAVAEMYMQENANISNQLRDLNAQLYMTNYIRDYLSVQKNQTKVLPVSSGLQNANIEAQISEYNDKLLQRNRLESNSSSENDLVKQMDIDLGSMRSAILVSIDNQIAAIDNQIRNLKHSERQALSRISSNPKQAEMLLSAERQQAVKEALYLFLLQKREENELSQSFTAYNTRVIKRPGGSMRPDAPKKRNILLVAFAIGLIVPLSLIYIKETLNTTLRGKKDLEHVPIPLLGEIPLSKQPKKWWQFWRKEQKVQDAVVEHGNRNAINEAFRILRTNLEFMVKKGSNVLLITSYNAGSGKSFLCVNTALSLAIKEKKVLVIDGDMRHASLSKWANSPNIGLSTFLSGKVNTIEEVMVKSVDGNVGLDMIPVGAIPPNPSELIGNGLLGEAIERLKQEYDYVFIDCPPIDVVADAQIVENYSDRTLFVVRTGLLERSMLEDLTALYNENRFKNMTLILNGTPMEKGKYSYRNGYYNSDYYSYS
ncbi:MAG: polysaccharide biosynthesis tyrosine autokinase [Paludibacteraceae bacterium]|nr:polysaccharide biosynthesis tyrosine autokinase [Paludibacteraceae bacterium]